MDANRQSGNRRGTVSAAAVSVALLVVAVFALTAGIRGSDGPPQPAAANQVPQTGQQAAGSDTPVPAPKPRKAARPQTGKPPASRAPNEPSAPKIGPFLPASAPTVLDIPSIGLHSSSFVDLKVTADGTLSVPGSAKQVGFYTGGPTPGQLGPAVIGAHVDSTKGPGVFYRLGAVKPGAKVHITRKDGTVATFVVDKVKLYPKDEFPTEQVYHGDFTRSEIRLVTCGGTFDPVKHYLDNVIVFGHLISTT